MGAAGGVDQQNVEAAAFARWARALGDGRRGFAGADRERCYARLLAEHAKLLLRRRTPGVERGHQHFLLVAALKPLAELRGRGVLPEPCRPTSIITTGGVA